MTAVAQPVAPVPGDASRQAGAGDDLPEDQPRKIRGITADEVFSAVGALVGAFGLSWLVYYQLLPLSGILGFIFTWLVAFLALYAGVTALSHPRTVVVSRVMAALITVASALVAFSIASVVIYTFWRGRHALWHWNFYTQNASTVNSTTRLNHGGILFAIVGSFIELAIALAIALPLGLGTAVFMTEVGGWFSRLVRTMVEAMTAVPDILAGLLVYVVLLIELGRQKNGLAASIALTVTMTPIVARSAEVSLRTVPGGLREASLALGSSHWATVWRVVLPTARPGLATALVLAVARGIGESAPLLIVSGATNYFNANPLNNPMNSLPLYIYTNARSGQNLYIDRAFGAASVLLAIVFVLFAITRLLARQRVGRQ